jgi:hypothetical protein
MVAKKLTVINLLASTAVFVSCSSNDNPELDEVASQLHGTITNPFVKTSPLGVDAKSENFVIKTSVGSTEYVVEIPHGGQDYDIVVPLAKLDTQHVAHNEYKESDAVGTDKEIVSNLPTLENKKRTMTSMLDKAYGVGKHGGPTQSPSYTLKLVKIKDHYKNKNFELALIEVNKLLSYYPTSSQLYKMKGSIFLKMRQLDLAERSWVKASELDPKDKILKTGIARLQKRIIKNTAPNDDVPNNLETPASSNLPANLIGH